MYTILVIIATVAAIYWGKKKIKGLKDRANSIIN